jgi:hypothetical protein
MAIDASIPLQIQPAANPLAQYAQLAQIQNMQTQGKLADAQLQGQQRGVERQNKLAQLLAQGGAPDQVEGNLRQGGFLDESLKFGKDRRENTKSDLSAEESRQKLFTGGLGMIVANPTPQTVQAVLDDLEKRTGRPSGPAREIFSRAQSPEQIAELAKRMGIELEKQMPSFQTRNTGGSTDTLAVDPITGRVAVANSVRNTQSPDSIASNAQSERNSLRTDARSRENTSALMSKPFEITGEDGKPVLVQQDKQGNIRPVANYLPKQGASKPLTEGQSKALLFGSRMQESGAVLDDLAAKGVNVSMPGSRAGFGIGTAVNALQPEDRQRLDQAKRDFINATLRRESGAVIAKEEFDNGDKQYFPQPGDSDAVIAQKKRNREVATRGILAEVPDSDNRVSKVRGGATGDFSKPGKAGPNIDALLDKYK